MTGSSFVLADHLAAVVVLDAATGLPVTLPYGTGTTRTTALDGTLAGVSVPTDTLDGGLPLRCACTRWNNTASVAVGYAAVNGG